MAKILLIDDDDQLRVYLPEVLQQRGHQVSCLECAEEGLRFLDGEKVDLVLADVNLTGMSGIEFLRAVRKQGVDLPVIMITGGAPTRVVQEVENLNALVVTKPAGGNDEFWKELEPKLKQALKWGPEGEVRAHFRRAFDAAFNLRQNQLVPYLEELLHHALIGWALHRAAGNQSDAENILGVRLEELREQAEASPQERHYRFVMRALILIHKHPDWPNARYAEYLDCSVAKLWGDPIIGPAMKAKKGTGRKLRSGFRDADGNVDAPDE